MVFIYFTLLDLIDLIIFLSPFCLWAWSCLCCRYCKRCFLLLYNFTIALLINSFIIVFAPFACVYWPLRFQIPKDIHNLDLPLLHYHSTSGHLLDRTEHKMIPS